MPDTNLENSGLKRRVGLAVPSGPSSMPPHDQFPAIGEGGLHYLEAIQKLGGTLTEEEKTEMNWEIPQFE